MPPLEPSTPTPFAPLTGPHPHPQGQNRAARSLYSTPSRANFFFLWLPGYAFFAWVSRELPGGDFCGLRVLQLLPVLVVFWGILGWL